MYLNYKSIRVSLLLVLLLITSVFSNGQVMNTGFPNNQNNNQNGGFGNNNGFNNNGQQNDSAKAKLNKAWKEETAKIYYNYLNSAKTHQIDTNLEVFHHYEAVQPWWAADLGNYGSSVHNQFFTPVFNNGLSLGYHGYDMYLLTLDSMRFYNTTHPYSSFQYLLGSKTEQNAAILHTQNINPLWNFAFNVKYNSAPGFFKYQNTTNLGIMFNTNYQSQNKRYYMAMGVLVNRYKQSENGGIQNVDDLTDPTLGNRSLVNVNFPGKQNSATVAAVTNMERFFDFYIQNNYSFGLTDTVYNKDSTSMSIQFTPRFRIKHQLQLHGDKHVYNDVYPDSARYARDNIGRFSLPVNDSVYGRQNWFYVDNKLSLNGFIGKLKELVQIEAGIGNRIDYFQTGYITGTDKQSSFGNYLFGQIRKEAFEKGQWEYQANANFFFTGDAVGNFNLSGSIGKDLGKWGQFAGGFRQNLSNPAYTYTFYKTNYFTNVNELNKTNITQLWAKTNISKINIELGVINSLMTNYIYYGNVNDTIRVQQQSAAFSVLQIYGRKEFRVGKFRWDNELTWQQATGGAPVHLPSLLIRERIGIVSPLFKSACIVAAGIEAKYNTPYYSDGYTPYLNQFYLQNDTKISNVPQVMAYFNFKVKTFRAFVMFDQLQQLVDKKNIILTPNYPSPSFLFRFGFNWILIN